MLQNNADIDNQHELQGILPAGNHLREGRDDLLIDMCLYFIAPHRFTPMDQEFIKKLSEEVTVAPICAKADAMTDNERKAFQKLIQDELRMRKSPCVLSQMLCIAVSRYCLSSSRGSVAPSKCIDTRLMHLHQTKTTFIEGIIVGKFDILQRPQ